MNEHRIIQGKEGSKEDGFKDLEIAWDTKPAEGISPPTVVQLRTFDGIDTERLPENDVAL